ncbi:type II secretion system F family protein [Youngiibacter multivorans]|uniref:Tight adherence protein C n=1 Tax=Youngiibacter multivorans TaxID=937251 RepID=A0ABS4G8D6_9CLOT|nr:type II secretion system F family protein [Youngiibacter multivorans]MBP1920801.1 tight adherence protein C [Youngiibacter multivorans]
MEILIYLLVFITTLYLFLLGYLVIFKKNQTVYERLNNIKGMSPVIDEDEDEMKQPFAERVIKPAYQKITHAISNAAPAEIKKKYENLIISSGSGPSVTFGGILAIQIMLGLFLGTVFFLLLRSAGNSGVVLAFFTGLIGFIFPYVSLNSKSIARMEGIQKSLPDMLDLLYVSVEAGLAFDMAMKKAAEKMNGSLSEEIIRAMEDISKGKEREVSLRGMVERTKVDDLAQFVSAVIQAEQLGSNIANVLRVQSTSMRQVRRQRAQEKAAKIPVKMLFPMILFILPTLFVVVLGPAVISIIETLSKTK